MEAEDHCRVCWGGPRGLADALIAPCGCTGTSGLIHVSCLFSWQLEKMRSLRDPMLCEVCGRQYEVPAQAASAWAAANREAAAGIAREIRVAARWQAARSALLWAGRVLLWGARVVVTLRHHWFRLGQVAYLTMEPEDVPQVKAGFLPPPEVRMRPFLDLAVRAVAIQYVTENMLGPGAGWQGGWQGQLAQLALVAAAAAGTRMLRARPRLRWDAPGAPLRVPTGELLAGKLAMWASLYASLKVSRLPALYLALFGPLSPRWLAEVTATGHYLLGAAWQNSMAEIKLALQTAWLQRLFQARPAALAALHAALLAGSGSSGAWMRRWVKRWMGA